MARRARGRFNYHLRAEPEPGGRHRLCRFTVSSAVSPVGPDLVGTSSAERERMSPQRVRFEGGVRASRIASSCLSLSPGPGGHD